MSIYDGVSKYYERWSTGDPAYIETYDFYTGLFRKCKSGRFLELGIGTGRISLGIIENISVEMHGIDSSIEMLNQCRLKEENQSSEGNIILHNMDYLQMNFECFFDGAIMPFRTIGHLLDNNDVELLLKKIYSGLKLGGWFVFDHYMFQKEWALEHDRKKILMYRDDNNSIFDYYEYDFDKNCMHCQIFLNDLKIDEFDFRWFSVNELNNLIKKTGFEIIDLFGDFDFSEWNDKSLEQIWVIKKPGYSELEMPCLEKKDVFR